MRSIFQSHLQTLGYSLQKHAGKVLFVAILVLSTFCVGLKSATIHSKVHQLWIQGKKDIEIPCAPVYVTTVRSSTAIALDLLPLFVISSVNLNAYRFVWLSTEGGRLEQELMYTQKSLGEKETTTHQLLIQTPRDPDGSVLTTDSMLTHLEVLRQATAVTVQMFDITWGLRDICNVPTTPDFDENFIEKIFENIIPCSIITPLDCFWEGSKLLGPEFPPTIP